MSKYNDNLKNRIIEASKSDTWEDAAKEWEISGWAEDDSVSSACLCGKENIRYKYAIRNRITGKILSPIGSSCIQKFGRKDMTEKAKIKEEMFKLLHVMQSEDHIMVDAKHFSRKLLLSLQMLGAFKAFDNDSENKNKSYSAYGLMQFAFGLRDKNILLQPVNRAFKEDLSTIIHDVLQPFLEDYLYSNEENDAKSTVNSRPTEETERNKTQLRECQSTTGLSTPAKVPSREPEGTVSVAPFKVIITGSRDFTDYNLLKSKCDQYLSKHNGEIEVVSRGTKGTDALGREYAREKGLLSKVFRSDKEKYGKRAGYYRNRQMGDYSNALIAFWDGESKGTEHMIKYAKEKGLAARIVQYKGSDANTQKK